MQINNLDELRTKIRETFAELQFFELHRRVSVRDTENENVMLLLRGITITMLGGKNTIIAVYGKDSFETEGFFEHLKTIYGK